MSLKTDDTLSLTLPKASGRSVRRKRRRPPGLFWFCLAICICAIAFAVSNYLQGYYLLAASSTWTAVFAWQDAMCVKDHRMIHPWWIISQLVNIALILVFGLTGMA